MPGEAPVRGAGWILGLLIFLAVFGDFLANERPLYCRVGGEVYFPVLRAYAVEAGLARWTAALPDRSWRERGYEAVVWPPIPWSPGSIDRQNLRAVGPLGPQAGRSWRDWHWLGTDTAGRDVAAGLIRGARLALAVGLGSMALAGLIGLGIGAVAGYFGDRGLRLRRSWAIAAMPGLLMSGFYLSVFSATEAGAALPVAASLALATGLGFLLDRIPALRHSMALPFDSLALRAMEVLSALPGLLLLLSLLAIIRRPNLLYLIFIIGLLSWPVIARFARAEMLRIRRQGYVEAARALGLTEAQVLWRHALPNGLRPVYVAIAFGIAEAVLLEAYLSFLGIGLPFETVSWGGMLGEARSQFSAWWLALFPGLGIFFTVWACNRWGERLARR